MQTGRDDYQFIIDLRSLDDETIEALLGGLGEDHPLNRLLMEVPDAGLIGIPEDEPVFLIRGQDACALTAMAAYAEAARMVGCYTVADRAEDHLERIRQWQGSNPDQRPRAVARGQGRRPDLPDGDERP